MYTIDDRCRYPSMSITEKYSERTAGVRAREARMVIFINRVIINSDKFSTRESGKKLIVTEQRARYYRRLYLPLVPLMPSLAF